MLPAGSTRSMKKGTPFAPERPSVVPPRLLQTLAQRFGNRKRVIERTAKRFGGFLQLGPMIALRLDVVAHPGLGRDQRTRVGAPLFALGAPLHLAHGGI